MAIHEEYVSLYVKDSRSISSLWKYTQIFIYTLTCLSGAIAYFGWNNINSIFAHNCVLYAKVKFGSNITGRYGSHLQVHESKFGTDALCSFCQYVPVCTVLFAAMWLTFFSMCGRGGRSEHGIPHSWRIVYPAMVFSFMAFLISILATVWLGEGLEAFCRHFKEINNKSSCQQLAHYKLPKGDGGDAFTLMFVMKLGTWGVLIGWLLAGLLLMTRCVFLIDFTPVKVTVWSGPMESGSEENLKRQSKESHLSYKEA